MPLRPPQLVGRETEERAKAGRRRAASPRRTPAVTRGRPRRLGLGTGLYRVLQLAAFMLLAVLGIVVPPPWLADGQSAESAQKRPADAEPWHAAKDRGDAALG